MKLYNPASWRDIKCCSSFLPEYRFQILLTIENGTVTHQRLLRPDEMVMSLSCFVEMARRAGWSVTPVSPDREE